MSNEELIQDTVEEEASLPLLPIPEITYRGSQNYIRYETPYRTIYEFTSENKFTVQPETWGDFYSILGVDGHNIVRNFVLTIDPSSKESFRRISAIEREEETIPQEIFDKQKEVDLDNARKGRFEAFKNDYQRGINLQIINGTLDYIPENLEKDAEKFAQDKMKEEDESKLAQEIEANKAQEEVPTVPTEVSEPQVLENTSTQEIVDPVTEPSAETEVLTEVTPTVDPTVEPVVEAPVVEPTEPVAPTEVPTETTNLEAPVTPTEEAPETVPVVETSEENPVVQTSEEPSVPTEEPIVEAPVEEAVTTTSKKKKSA